MSETVDDKDLSAKGTGDAAELNTFASLGIVKPLCECIDGIGWKIPTDIQRMSIPEGYFMLCTSTHTLHQ